MIRNKFDLLAEQVAGNIDVLMISETKIDESFPVGNLLLPGFSVPYRSDRDSKGGGILLYVREDIPSNLLSIENKPIEGFYVELNLRKSKSLVNCSYNPHKSSIDNHLLALSDSLDVYSSTYEEIVILGDFNVEKENNYMKIFCKNYNFKTLIKQPTCYKNPDNPTCTDLILTNVPRSFKSACVLEAWLSDFHLMTLTVMRKRFKNF